MPGMPLPTSGPRLTRAGGVIASAVLAALALAACGGAAAGPSATTAAPVGTRAAGVGAGAPRNPGVTGLIAAIEGTTMQVQSTTKQTAVGWTPSTRITRSAAGTPADIVVGSCVVVRSVMTDTTAGSAAGANGPVPAASVAVLPAVNGSCLDAVGGAGGIRAGDGFPTGAPVNRPAGDQLPPGATGAPGGPGGRGFGGFGVAGQVMSLGDGEFIVASIGRPDDGGAAGVTASASVATTPVTVTILSATTVTVTKAAAAGDIKLGLCATAIGAADDIGKVTATSIVLRDPVSGSCATAGGFGGPGAPGASGVGAPGGGSGGAVATSAAGNG